jgi:uncharacterized protein
MRFVLAGASGYLGTALRDHLARGGHDVVRLVRGEARSPSESTWDAYRGHVDSDVLSTADVVVSLSGATIGRPWTQSHRRTILDSRIKSTTTLAKAIAALDRKPTFLSQSGMNIYGDSRGDEVLTEDSPAGSGFLSGVVTEWEGSAEVAAESGARVCLMRSGVVLGPGGGTLRLMQIPFRLGVGGRLGSGAQYFSAISLHDWVRAVDHLASTSSASGPFNLTAPEAPTNAELTAEFGRRLHRPTKLPVPELVLKTALGELSGLLLGSLRGRPRRLLESGFRFDHPDVTTILGSALDG